MPRKGASKQTREELTAQQREWRAANPANELVTGARRRSVKRGTICTITTDDVVIPEVCPVFKTPLARSKNHFAWDSPTLDELVVGKGYTPDNVLVMSFKANAMKSDCSPEELLLFADWVYEMFGGKDV